MTAYPGTQSVVRALTLLKQFTDERPSWRLSELSEEVGLNRTTTFRLLKALESEGLLQRSAESDSYSLGHTTLILGSTALRANPLRGASHQVLRELAEQTGETASLEILSGRDTLVLDEVIGTHVMTGVQSVGTTWPAHATSTGKMLLSLMEPWQVRALLDFPLKQLTGNTIVDANRLLEELAHTCSRGYAIAHEELEAGLVAVAAPVINFDGQAVGAISLGGPLVRFDDELIRKYGSQIRRAANKISSKLGAPGFD